MGKTFWGVVSAAVEQSGRKANMVTQGDGKFGPWGWPRDPPNQKKNACNLFLDVCCSYFQIPPLSEQRCWRQSVLRLLLLRAPVPRQSPGGLQGVLRGRTHRPNSQTHGGHKGTQSSQGEKGIWEAVFNPSNRLDLSANTSLIKRCLVHA